jgi:hypothetical protein
MVPTQVTTAVTWPDRSHSSVAILAHLRKRYTDCNCKCRPSTACHTAIRIIELSVARNLFERGSLRLEGYLAIALADIPWTLALDGIQDAVLYTRLQSYGFESMPPAVIWGDIPILNNAASEFREPILEPAQRTQHVAFAGGFEKEVAGRGSSQRPSMRDRVYRREPLLACE